MLLNNVAVGEAYETLYNNPALVLPPDGYDSVSQAHSSGGELG